MALNTDRSGKGDACAIERIRIDYTSTWQYEGTSYRTFGRVLLMADTFLVKHIACYAVQGAEPIYRSNALQLA